jgi:DNA-binding CsgD family transcriptional regulator/PAS domain-containing protein
MEMGADRSIVLEPRCPGGDDAGVLYFLHLVKMLTRASWVELELQPIGSERPQIYRLGSGRANPRVVAIEVGSDFEASLRHGKAAVPATDLATLLSETLSRVLEVHRLRIESELLSRALESATSSILLLDGEGRILFANSNADQLLSLQTENELLVTVDGKPKQPLYSLLCSLVERVTSSEGTQALWEGVLELENGRILTCEVMRIAEPPDGAPDAVAVTLRSTGSAARSRIAAFSAHHGLSPREREVLLLLDRGLTTGAMAEELGISPHTVRDHLKHLYRKTSTTGRSELLGMISRLSRSATER